MASVWRLENGEIGLWYGDGLPFGHEYYEVAGLWPSVKSRKYKGLLRHLHSAVVNLNESADSAAKQQIDSWFAEEEPAPDDLLPYETTVEHLASLSLSGLTAFIKSHNRRFELQTERLKSVDLTLKDNGNKKIAQLCEQGILPDSVEAKLYEAMQRSGDFRPIDSFESGGMGADGYCTEGGKIYLANLFVNKPDFTGISGRMLDVSFHESMHAMGFLPGLGFMNGVADDKFSMPFLEESFVAHITQLAADGAEDPEILDPYERINPTTCSYHFERALLAAFDVSVEQLVEAYFSPRGEETSKARLDLMSKLNQSAEHHFPKLGDQAFYKMSENYRQERIRDRAPLVKRWLFEMGYSWLELDEEVDEEAVAAIKLVPVS